MRRSGPAAVGISNVASFMSPTSYFVAGFDVSTHSLDTQAGNTETRAEKMHFSVGSVSGLCVGRGLRVFVVRILRVFVVT